MMSKGGGGKQPMPRLTFSSRQQPPGPGATPVDEPASKLSRADCERQRRNKINGLIEELARLVPLVATSSRKMDKMSVLRLTVAFLRLYHDVTKQPAADGQEPYKLSSNSSTPDSDLTSMLLESVGGFLFVVSAKGILLFATDTITKILGHSMVDVLGCPFSSIVHPEDVAILARELNIGSSNKADKAAAAAAADQGQKQRSFYVRMLNVANEPERSYETIHIVGYTKNKLSASQQPPLTPPLAGPSHDTHTVFVGVGRRVASEPIQELSPGTGCDTNQWLTRHELDGQITYSDPRGAAITGFLPGESQGFSPYALLHPDDISAVVHMHNMFFTKGHIPCTVFRMFTKSREILYIKTTTHMVVDMWSSKPRFIISVNEVQTPRMGRRLMARQRRLIAAGGGLEAIEDKAQSPGSVVSDQPASVGSAAAAGGGDVEDEEAQADDVMAPELITYEEVMSPIQIGLELVSEQEVNVVVGDSRFTIDLSLKDNYRVDKSVGGGVKTIFDITAPKTNDNRHVPFVEPEFIGSVPSPGPGASVRRLSECSEAAKSSTYCPTPADNNNYSPFVASSTCGAGDDLDALSPSLVGDVDILSRDVDVLSDIDRDTLLLLDDLTTDASPHSAITNDVFSPASTSAMMANDFTSPTQMMGNIASPMMASPNPMMANGPASYQMMSNIASPNGMMTNMTSPNQMMAGGTTSYQMMANITSPNQMMANITSPNPAMANVASPVNGSLPYSVTVNGTYMKATGSNFNNSPYLTAGQANDLLDCISDDLWQADLTSNGGIGSFIPYGEDDLTLSSTAAFISAGNNCFTNSAYDQPVYSGGYASTQQPSSGAEKQNVVYTSSLMRSNQGNGVCSSTELSGSQQLSPGYGQLVPDLMQGQGHAMSPGFRQQQVTGVRMSPSHGQSQTAEHNNLQSMFTDDMIRRELLTGGNVNGEAYVSSSSGKLRSADCSNAYLFAGGSSAPNGQLGYQVNGSTNGVSSNNALINGDYGQTRPVLDSLNAMFVSHLH